MNSQFLMGCMLIMSFAAFFFAAAAIAIARSVSNASEKEIKMLKKKIDELDTTLSERQTIGIGPTMGQVDLAEAIKAQTKEYMTMALLDSKLKGHSANVLWQADLKIKSAIKDLPQARAPGFTDPVKRRFGHLESAIAALIRNLRIMNGIVLAFFSGPFGRALQRIEESVFTTYENLKQVVNDANANLMQAEANLRKLARINMPEQADKKVAEAWVERNHPEADYTEKLEQFSQYMANYPENRAKHMAELEAAREAVEAADKALKEARGILLAFEKDPDNQKSLSRMAELQTQRETMASLGPSLEEVSRNLEKSQNMGKNGKSSPPPATSPPPSS